MDNFYAKNERRQIRMWFSGDTALLIFHFSKGMHHTAAKWNHNGVIYDTVDRMAWKNLKHQITKLDHYCVCHNTFYKRARSSQRGPNKCSTCLLLLLIAFELQTIAVNYMPGLFWRAQNNEAFWPWKLISKPKVVRDHLPISEMGKFSSSFYFKVVNLLLT